VRETRRSIALHVALFFITEYSKHGRGATGSVGLAGKDAFACVACVLQPSKRPVNVAGLTISKI